MKFEQLIIFEVDSLIDSALAHLDTSLQEINDNLNDQYMLVDEVVFDRVFNKYYPAFNEFSLNKKNKLNDIIITFSKDNAKSIAKDLDNIDHGLEYISNTYSRKYIEKRTDDEVFNKKTKEVIVKVAYKQFKSFYIAKANNILKERNTFYKLNVKLRVNNALDIYRNTIKVENEQMIQSTVKKETKKAVIDSYFSKELNSEIDELFDKLEVPIDSNQEDLSITIPLNDIDNMFERLENLDNVDDIKVDVPTEQLMDVDFSKSPNITSKTSTDDITAKSNDNKIEYTDINNVDVKIEKTQKSIGFKIITTLLDTIILIVLILFVFYIFIEFIQ